MDDSILFNPDNRLIGSAIGDLGMYGGQSDAHFSVHAARDEATVEVDAAAAPSGAPVPTAELSVGASPPAESDASVAAALDSGSGAYSTQSFLIAPVAPEPVASELIAPEPITIQPIALAGAFQFDAAPAAHGTGAPMPALDLGSEADMATVANAPVMGTATTLIETLAADPVGGMVSPVSDLVGDVLPGTVGALDDTLDGLAGSDPLAGVETLVNMVATSDTFDLAPVVAPLLETVSDTGLAVVDTLIGEDSATDSLLGGGHNEGGELLGIDHHDNPLGL